MTKVHIVGSLRDPSFYSSLKLSEALNEHQVTCSHEALNPIEFLNRLESLQKVKQKFLPSQYRGVLVEIEHKGSLETLKADQFYDWSFQTFGVSRDSNLDFERVAQEAFETYLRGLKHTIISMDFQISKADIGRIWIELFDDVVPLSTKQFTSFVVGSQIDKETEEPLTYKNTTVNRVVKESWFQAGEILDSHNKPFQGTPLPDENFILPHAHRGTVSFVNKGPHSNFSQFMIAMRPMPYLNQKFVCIGRCVDGDDVLQAIDDVKTRYEKPTSTIRIVKSEVFCEGEAPAPKERLPPFF